MPSLKTIRKRIGSVKNTRKITRAMKMVAAAKLRRAQDAIIAARPYANALTTVVSELSEVAGADAHPLFAVREGFEGRERLRVTVVALTSDRGLAGAFNANVIKRTEAFIREELTDADVGLRLIGKKANAYFSRRKFDITSFDGAPVGATALQVAGETATRIIDDFTSGKIDRVYVVYNEFKSAITQNTLVKQVLPVIPEKVTDKVAGKTAAAASTGADYVYEPGKQELLTRLVPLYVQIGLYRAALESIAGEFGARMSAMESATKNAGEMINKLTLQYNRARQASITKELLEIIGGAEALKG